MASLIWVAAPHFEAEDAAKRVGWVCGDDADDFVTTLLARLDHHKVLHRANLTLSAETPKPLLSKDTTRQTTDPLQQHGRMTNGYHLLIDAHLVDPISTANNDRMLSLSDIHTVVSLRSFANVI